jgi:hypothetical protein
MDGYMRYGKEGNNHGLTEIPLWDFTLKTEENHE